MALRRDAFPVTADFTWLNSAAESPLNTHTLARTNEYLATTLRAPHLKPSSVRTDVRRLLAELLGGSPADFALVGSTCQGINVVAAGISWQAGDNVVVPAGEHWSNTFPWLQLNEKGVEVRFALQQNDRAVLPESIEALVDERTRVVATAHVQFATGHRSDLRRLSAIAHKRGALLVVDGIQAAGCCPLHLEDDGIDVYAAGGFKWLLGTPGTGFLYVSPAARLHIRPTLPGMFAADNANTTELVYHEDARQYESGSVAYALFHGWTAGLALLCEVGVENIFRRNQLLAALLVEGLVEKPHISVVSPVGSASERSQIVVITFDSVERNSEVCAKLAENGIIVANRGDTVRLSPNFFNTEEEVAKLLALL
jgi:cysteine desulfurase/selenocysteine lyase